MKKTKQNTIRLSVWSRWKDADSVTSWTAPPGQENQPLERLTHLFVQFGVIFALNNNNNNDDNNNNNQ